MKFESKSQAGQDLFVHALLPKTDGAFVEIGCSHPIELSNTYALEQLGWRGIGIDSSEHAIALCAALRSRHSKFRCVDATVFNWAEAFVTDDSPFIFDYASVDVDEHTHEALKRLLESKARFRVLTVEHDAYQRGDRLRAPNRALLKDHGFEILAADVHSNGCCFEDWVIDPALVDLDRAYSFRTVGLDWRDVLRKGGVL